MNKIVLISISVVLLITVIIFIFTNNKLNDTIEDKKTRLARLTNEIKSLKDKISSMKENDSNKLKEILKLNEKVKEQESLYLTIHDQRSILTSKHIYLEEEHDELKDEHEELLDEHEELQDEMNDIEADKEELDNDLTLATDFYKTKGHFPMTSKVSNLLSRLFDITEGFSNTDNKSQISKTISQIKKELSKNT